MDKLPKKVPVSVVYVLLLSVSVTCVSRDRDGRDEKVSL